MKTLKLLSLFLLFVTVLFSCDTTPGNAEAAVYVYSRKIGGGDEKLVKTYIFNVAGDQNQRYTYTAPSGREMAKVELVANNELKEKFAIDVWSGNYIIPDEDITLDDTTTSYTFKTSLTQISLAKNINTF